MVKWPDGLERPDVDQHTFGDTRVSYNPDSDRFHVEVKDKDWPGEDTWNTVATFKNTPKGYSNAVDRFKREIREGK